MYLYDPVESISIIHSGESVSIFFCMLKAASKLQQ